MIIIQPRDVEVDSTNVAGDGNPAYNPATTYNADDVVTVAEDNHNYRALDTVTGVYPPEGAIAFPPTWLDLGPTNQYGMFDRQAGTETVNAGSIVVVFTPDNPVDAVAFFGVEADTLRVRAWTSGAALIYDKTFNLELAPVNPLDPPERRTDFAAFDIPGVTGMYLGVDITYTGKDAKCGLVLPGVTRTIGSAAQGTSVGILDYSRKETDQFGRPVLVQRRFNKTARIPVEILTADIDMVHRTLSTWRASPVVWVGHPDIQSTIIYGFYRDFDIVISGPMYSQTSLYLEGLI